VVGGGSPPDEARNRYIPNADRARRAAGHRGLHGGDCRPDADELPHDDAARPPATKARAGQEAQTVPALCSQLIEMDGLDNLRAGGREHVAGNIEMLCGWADGRFADAAW
jgi:hypothetical protein